MHDHPVINNYTNCIIRYAIFIWFVWSWRLEFDYHPKSFEILWVQITRSHTRPQAKMAVRQVIADGHFDLPQGFVWVCMGKSLMAEWLEQASQWHEMCCHDSEVMSLNPGGVELGLLSTSVLSRTWTINILTLSPLRIPLKAYKQYRKQPCFFVCLFCFAFSILKLILFESFYTENCLKHIS